MNKKAKNIRTQKEEKRKTSVVYCGPSIKGVVKQYEVFYNGLPLAISALCEKHKFISLLIVPVSEFAKAKKALTDSESRESIIFNKITENLKGGK